MVVTYALQEIHKAAEALVPYFEAGNVITFTGEMGAGKTTLIRTVCELLGVKDAVSSPTFSIINEYTTAAGQTLIHMDLYRIRTEQEALVAGVEDALFSGNTCLVEWPQHAAALIPDESIGCTIELLGNAERRLTINQ